MTKIKVGRCVQVTVNAEQKQHVENFYGLKTSLFSVEKIKEFYQKKGGNYAEWSK